MYYTVYKITNNITGKIYIGAHRTQDLDDNYMGSGELIKQAIRKHGQHNFTKTYLAVYDNPDDMWEMESKLVTEDFVGSGETYNMCVGGLGGQGGLNEFLSMKEARQRINAERRCEYELNVATCQHCEQPLSFRKRTNKFCDKSCAASHNNRLRTKKSVNKKRPRKTPRQVYDETPKLCAECSKPIKFEARNQQSCCSRSCAAKQRNRGRPVSEITRQLISNSLRETKKCSTK